MNAEQSNGRLAVTKETFRNSLRNNAIFYIHQAYGHLEGKEYPIPADTVLESALQESAGLGPEGYTCLEIPLGQRRTESAGDQWGITLGIGKIREIFKPGRRRTKIHVSSEANEGNANSNGTPIGTDVLNKIGEKPVSIYMDGGKVPTFVAVRGKDSVVAISFQANPGEKRTSDFFRDAKAGKGLIQMTAMVPNTAIYGQIPEATTLTAPADAA